MKKVQEVSVFRLFCVIFDLDKSSLDVHTPEYPPSDPSDSMTLWQGNIWGSGSLPSALPTA